jgi:hypothetical protein
MKLIHYYLRKLSYWTYKLLVEFVEVLKYGYYNYFSWKF